MWNHSVGTAISARIIGKAVDKDIEEVAFLGGLMHDFGKVVMNNATPQIYAEVMMVTYNEGIEAVCSREEPLWLRSYRDRCRGA